MPRKGENIRKRKDGRWEARYEKCRDQNGRIQYGYLYGRTYEAVKKKKLAILCQNNLQNSPGKCYVFRNLSEEWMLSMRYAVKLSTYACYETLLDTHILPEFGDMPLKYISSASVYSFSEKLKQQGLSPRTIKNLLILFHSILRYGEKQGYLNLSQLEFRYPKINTSPFQLISHEHLTKLITVLSAEDSEFPIGILLCIYTGIRVGELSGIRWEDIDFDKKLLHIRRTISRIKNLDYSGESDDEPKTVLMIGPPKSVSSIRDIPIPDFLLKKMKRIAAEPDSYLLTGTNRKCMEPRNIQRKFQKLLQQCEIPSINIHSLRHAFATRCTEMGFDSKTLSEILGHSSVKITMDIYVHSSIRPSIFPSREKNVKFELLDNHKKKELECHIFSKSCERWRPDQDGWEFNGEGCWAHFLKKEIALENQFIPGVAVGEDTIWALTMLNSSKDYRIGMLYEKWYYYIQNDYSVLNKYNPKIVGQLTLPVDILEKKYGASTGIVHAAYTDWLLMKLKHICFRAYLAEENTDPFNKKVSEFSKVLHTAPWIEVLNRRNTQPFKKRLKFFLYDKNIALYFYSCLKLVKRKKYDIEDGSRNESKN